MISNESDLTDLQLVHQVLDLVPSWTWPVVRKKLSELFTDNMSSVVLTKLTGDPGGFKQAELILNEYYDNDAKNYELIEDAFRILGTTETLYALEGLKLDTIPQTNA